MRASAAAGVRAKSLGTTHLCDPPAAAPTPPQSAITVASTETGKANLTRPR